MKNLVKIAAVAVLSLGFGVAAQAQSDDATIAASANVVDQIEVVRVQDLTFGMVMQGLPKYVNYKGGVAGGGVNAQGTPTSGVFNLFAGAGTNLTIEFTTPPNGLLTGPGSATMPIVFDKDDEDAATPTAAVGVDSDTAIPFNVGGPHTIPNFATNPIAGRNVLQVFIGGTVKPAANQPSGSYTGEILLTATYN